MIAKQLKITERTLFIYATMPTCQDVTTSTCAMTYIHNITLYTYAGRILPNTEILENTVETRTFTFMSHI